MRPFRSVVGKEEPKTNLQDGGKNSLDFYKMLYILNSVISVDSATRCQNLRSSGVQGKLPPSESRVRIPEEYIGISQNPPVEYYYTPPDAYSTKTPQQQTDCDIREVMLMSGCNFHQAVKALRLNQGNAVEAIISIQKEY